MTRLLHRTEEIRLEAFLGAAYQRVFILRGELGRMEAEMESVLRMPEGEQVPDNPHSEGYKEYLETLGKRIYVSTLMGKINSEINYLESQIKAQTT